MGWVVVPGGMMVVGMDGLGGSSVADNVFGSWISCFPRFLSLDRVSRS